MLKIRHHMNARHEALAEGVARCPGQRLLRWRPVSRGYSPALRLIVSCADGTSVFVKAATDTRTAAWLRTEYGVYSQVHGGFLPTMRAWVDDPCAPILVLEDLSGAVWQTPWTTSRITRVLDTLRQVAATPAPAWLPRLEERRSSLSGWAQVMREPEPFLQVGLCSAAWLSNSINALVAAETRAQLNGEDRKSTRLNSSHVAISYAVFCLK